MKKVIFLLVFLVSFAFSYTATNINTSSQYKTDNLQTSAPSGVVQSFRVSASTCANVFWPGNGNYIYGICPSAGTQDNLNYCDYTKTAIPEGQNQYGNLYHYEETRIIQCQCSQPSGGCPVGQTFDEQTCTCKCNPLPNYPILLSPPVTQHSDCILTNPDIVVSDGLLGYIGDVSWSSCESKCYGSTTPCPPHTAIVNGSCQIPPSPPCTGSSSTSFGASDGPSGKMCYIHFYCNGTEIGRQQVSCDTSTPDSNSTGGGGDNGGGDSDSTGGGGDNGGGDSDSTGGGGDNGGGDSNSTGGGDNGDGDSDSTGSGSGTTTTTTGGDGGGSTSGDSNSTGTGTGTGDSNSTGGSGGDTFEYEESDDDKDGKAKIGEALQGAYDTLDKIKSDYARLQSRLQSGVTPISLSSGSAPEFCAVVFNKQICINLCDSFGYFYSILYYIFLALFTVMSLRIFYTAFKMR